MAAAVIADRLVKRYGNRPAVRDISFAVEEGEVVGLLGPNGSGKSTVLRILAGYLSPSAGTVRVAGFDVNDDSLAARRHIGYVPEDAPLYDSMRVGEFLRFMARIKGCAGYEADTAAAEAGERLGLGEVFGAPIGKLSRGYRQRAAIAQALLNDPPVLLLDEPTSSLDAYQVIAVRDLVRSLRGRCTIVMASHVMAEIEKVASRVMILVDGKLLTLDAMQERPAAARFHLVAAGPGPAVLACLEQVPGVAAVAADPSVPDEPSAYVVEALPGETIAEDLARNLVERGFGVSQLQELKPDLEQIFLALTKQAASIGP